MVKKIRTVKKGGVEPSLVRNLYNSLNIVDKRIVNELSIQGFVIVKSGAGRGSSSLDDTSFTFEQKSITTSKSIEKNISIEILIVGNSNQIECYNVTFISHQYTIENIIDVQQDNNSKLATIIALANSLRST